jgi:hypothetical protein
MMSTEAIQDVQAQAAARASAQGMVPFTVWPEDLERPARELAGYIPFIGDYLPPGYERVNLEDERGAHGLYMGDNQGYGAWMVDASGMGAPGEPALTVDEWRDVVRPGLAYAVVEAGQFQVKIGAFRRTGGAELTGRDVFRPLFSRAQCADWRTKNMMRRGRIVRFEGSWMSGLGALVIEDHFTGCAEHVYCENAQTVRCLEGAFGDVIAPGHTVNQAAIAGREIFWSADGLGVLLGFSPVEGMDPDMLVQFETACDGEDDNGAPCDLCEGVGRVVDREEPNAADDGMMPCPRCEGSGKREAPCGP